MGPRPAHDHRVGFWLIAGAFAIVMTGTTLPTPLYPVYEQRFAFAPVLITVIFAVYALGVILGLLLFGHLSDEIGRRRVLMPGVVFSALSAIAFLLAGGLTALFAGRILSGVSAGIFSGAATAALIDLVAEERRRLAATLAVAANMGGLAGGPLISGFFAQYAPLPLRLPYALDLVLVAGAVIATWAAPETVPATSKRIRLRLQRLRLPTEIRGIFIKATIAGAGAFAVSGLFSAVAPSFLATVLHDPNHLLAGFVVSLVFALSALGQIAVERVPGAAALAIACAVLIAGVGTLAIAIAGESLVSLLISASLAGFGMGLALGFGLAQINEQLSEHRGEVTATYFVLLYVGLSVPVIAVGLISSAIGLSAAGLIFCAVVAASLLGVLLTLLPWQARNTS